MTLSLSHSRYSSQEGRQRVEKKTQEHISIVLFSFSKLAIIERSTKGRITFTRYKSRSCWTKYQRPSSVQNSHTTFKLSVSMKMNAMACEKFLMETLDDHHYVLALLGIVIKRYVIRLLFACHLFPSLIGASLASTVRAIKIGIHSIVTEPLNRLD